MDDPNNFKLTPHPDSQHHKRVLLYGLGAIFFVVIVGGIGYLLGTNNNSASSSKIPTSSQQIITQPTLAATPSAGKGMEAYIPAPSDQIYSNNTYGFTLYYPASLKLIATNDSYITLQPSTYGSNNDFTQITISANKGSYSSTGLVDQPNTTVGGVPATTITKPAGQNPPQIGTYFNKNNMYFTIWMFSNNQAYQTIYNQILSSFKFNDQIQNLLIPADSQSPASGVCGGPTLATLVTVTIDSATPIPPCIKVSSNQQLQIINKTSQAITFTLGQNSFSLAPNQQYTITQTFGSYLAPGVHDTKVSVYGGGSGPEVWLQ